MNQVRLRNILMKSPGSLPSLRVVRKRKLDGELKVTDTDKVQMSSEEGKQAQETPKVSSQIVPHGTSTQVQQVTDQIMNPIASLIKKSNASENSEQELLDRQKERDQKNP
jgi:hypothetical protein